MSGELLNGGAPIVVTTPRDRIGHGPWARLFATAVVGAEGSAVAERGRALARAGAVYAVSVGPGELSARVIGSDGAEYAVAFAAPVVPPRVWAAIGVTARRNARLAAAIEGREQSVHLEHLMRFDWTSPLVPARDDLVRTCTCANVDLCEHVATFAYVVADLVDGAPSLLLQWRGCGAVEADLVELEPASIADADSSDGPWHAGALPPPRPLRPLPIGAVLMCLGPTELRVGGGDLADALRRAYGAFAEPSAR
ncbi:MAG TPA: hypothetical protein VMU73_05580 [Gaiellaceae bacterium]|nr:hypothetical protein [Gaiellaceae bacterium]